MPTIFRLPLLLLAALSAPAAAQAIQDLDQLERRLVIALGADIGQPGGPATPIDRRLKLAACPSEIAIDPPAMGAVALRCPAIGWRIRVPLVRAAAESVAQRAPVIRRGDPVELQAGTGAFVVSSQVVAEQDGAPGDRIRVRGDKAKPPIIAEVVDTGLVRLPGFN